MKSAGPHNIMKTGMLYVSFTLTLATTCSAHTGPKRTPSSESAPTLSPTQQLHPVAAHKSKQYSILTLWSRAVKLI